MKSPPELVALPGGVYWMGGVRDDKFVTDVERPRHRVTIAEGVRLGRFPVTEAEYLGNGKKVPVVGIAWQEALDFAEWVGAQVGGEGRLPTEAEWEHAARGGCEGGQMPTVGEANFLYNEDGVKVGRGAVSEVGRYPLNAFGYGDLFGNVLEWVQDDWWPGYEGASGDGSARCEENWVRKVVRGGGWDYLPRMLRASWRDGLAMTARQDNLGFRVAVDFRKIEKGIR